VIRMEVSQEHFRHIRRVDCQSGHARRQAAPTIEQQLLRSRQNQRADTQSLRIYCGTAGRPKQYYLQIGVAADRDRLLRVDASMQPN
jgi:hypothetical protein